MPRAARRVPRHPGLVPLQGTTVRKLPGATSQPAPRSRAPLTISVRLRSAKDNKALLQVFDQIVAGRRPPMTRKEFAAQFGATDRDVARVRRFARAHGFKVSRVGVGERTVFLSGPTSALADAFGVERVAYTLGSVSWIGHEGSVFVPAALADCVTGVFGFDNRPQASRRPDAQATVAPKIKVSYTAPQVAALYRFPPGLDGRGESVGVIALGGGYRESDLHQYFKRLRLPHPRFTPVSVCGARNAPTGSTAAFDGEVTGDIETVGALVPAARIVVYFAPNSARGFIEAMTAAVHDTRRNISVLSISWGQAEVHWARQNMRIMNEIALEAAVLGVTICCASGDHGSFADAHDRLPHVCFPASSPFVVACGGTTLLARKSRISSESVWHNEAGASGGGVSVVFAMPWWQRQSRVPKASNGRRGRGVPDVASNADPTTGYRFFARGRWHVGAGTSAAAPLWAGLVARINQLRGRQRGAPLGLLTPFLYRQYRSLVAAGAVRPITKGNNGAFRAHRGWNACTGVGVPHGEKLAAAYLE